MLRIENIAKQYRGFSLSIGGFSIDTGACFTLLGPTGSGKTLFMNIIAGLIPPDRGHIFLGDRDITLTPPEGRGFGIVYQDSALFPHLGVTGNIAFGLRIRGVKKPVISERVSAIMEELGISHLEGRGIEGLSGGEKQRVALARALILEPAVILLDEPFNSLDYMTREDMTILIKTIRERYRPTIFHITHNFEEAMALSDRVGVINNGSLIQDGTVQDVFRRPADAFVANFVGSRNIFSGKIIGSGDSTIFETEDGVSLYVGREVDSNMRNAVIGADEIILSREESKSSATNLITGMVVDIMPKRGINEISLDIGTVIHAYITSRSLADLDIKKGDRLYCIFKGSALHFF